MGALFGEAVVICNPKLQEDFRYLIKQKGDVYKRQGSDREGEEGS